MSKKQESYDGSEWVTELYQMTRMEDMMERHRAANNIYNRLLTPMSFWATRRSFLFMLAMFVVGAGVLGYGIGAQ